MILIKARINNDNTYVWTCIIQLSIIECKCTQKQWWQKHKFFTQVEVKILTLEVSNYTYLQKKKCKVQALKCKESLKSSPLTFLPGSKITKPFIWRMVAIKFNHSSNKINNIQIIIKKEWNLAQICKSLFNIRNTRPTINKNTMQVQLNLTIFC